MATASLVPRPANVIGIKPIIFAIGYNKRKYRYGISKPSAITTIYSWVKIIIHVKTPRIVGRIRLFRFGKSL